MKQFFGLLLASVVSPLAGALLVGLIGAWTSVEQWRVLTLVISAVTFYGLGLTIALTVLLPVHLLTRHRNKLGPVHYVVISCLASIVLFVAFSLWTGGFDSLRDSIWFLAAAILLGWLFGRMVRNY